MICFRYVIVNILYKVDNKKEIIIIIIIIITINASTYRFSIYYISICVS